MQRAIDPTFFPTPADFQAWLEEHHVEAEMLWVGFYKKATGKPSVTWEETVDEALATAGSTGSEGRSGRSPT